MVIWLCLCSDINLKTTSSYRYGHYFAKCLLYTYNVWISCQWLVTGRWFCQGTPVSSTNKTDRHVMKVALNTINQSIIVYKFWSLRTTNSGTFIGTNMNLHITYMLNSFLLIYIIQFPLLGLKKILIAVYVKFWTPKRWDHMELYITSLYLISQWHFLMQLHFHSWFVCMQRDF